MSRPGITTKPCHGCGSTVEHYTGSLCDDCRPLLLLGKQIVEREKAATNDEPEPFFFKERSYALPYIYNGDTVKKAFFDLGNLLSTPTAAQPRANPPDAEHDYSWRDDDRWVWPHGSTDSRSDWQISRAAKPSHVAALRTTYAAVVQALKAAEAEGHKQGRSLLARLAAGELTADQFNDQALRRETP